MAYTKIQLLDAFCRFHNYPAQVNTGTEEEPVMVDNTETKVDFLKRVEREISLRDAKRQLKMEARQTANETVDTGADGVTL